MTPVPAPAPLKSILKSSRTRSHSMSINPPEAPANVVPVRVERGSSKLSGKSTVTATTVYTKAALKEEAIALHWPLMRFDPNKRTSSDRPLLYFDAGFDPTQPRNLRKKRPESAESWSPLSDADRNLPVSTHCTLTKMVIQCPQIRPITVRRSEGIRCIDVFVAIYDAYHRRLDEDELPSNMARYLPHFDKRCEDTGIKGERMRRVDLLRGKRIFDGLTRSGADWKLEFYSPTP
ncbi:hypothetical protein C8R46DRAFT_1038532 [Mycena filopes]|nr:hypothetical protein C8R46DRAFT_1038532 [Mycena filopes]